jgi:hypothetical protein
VATAYRDHLTRSRLAAWPEWIRSSQSSTDVSAEAKRLFHDPQDVTAAVLVWNALASFTSATDVASAEAVIERCLNYRPEVYDSSEDAVRRVVTQLYDPHVAPPKLYQVSIPRESQFMQWDTTKQPPIVNKAFRSLMGRDYKNALTRNYAEPTGEQCYRLLSKNQGSDKAASLALLKRGVHGIRYLDGNSRHKGRGSYNYVLFDGDLASITAAE